MGDGRTTCYKSCTKAHKISSLGGGGGTPRLENYNLGRWRRKLKGGRGVKIGVGGGVGEKRGVKGVRQKGKAEKGGQGRKVGTGKKGIGKGKVCRKVIARRAAKY
jgi:hypothetical protein